MAFPYLFHFFFFCYRFLRYQPGTFYFSGQKNVCIYPVFFFLIIFFFSASAPGKTCLVRVLFPSSYKAVYHLSACSSLFISYYCPPSENISNFFKTLLSALWRLDLLLRLAQMIYLNAHRSGCYHKRARRLACVLHLLFTRSSKHVLLPHHIFEIYLSLLKKGWRLQ